MKIGERGQVTIPKVLREKYGLFPEIEIEFIEGDNGINLQKKARHLTPIRQVLGLLDKTGATDKYIEEIRGR